MPKRATIYTYPWELSDEGVDNALNTIANTAGLNSVTPRATTSRPTSCPTTRAGRSTGAKRRALLPAGALFAILHKLKSNINGLINLYFLTFH